jgi:hypothetical protein
MKSSLKRLRSPTIILVAAVIGFAGVRLMAHGAEGPPDGPFEGVPQKPIGPESPVPLWLPLPEPVEVLIGEQWFLVPAGATAVEVREGPPAADAATGKIAGPPVEHPRYWLISRGESTVKIDSFTGVAGIAPEWDDRLPAHVQ